MADDEFGASVYNSVIQLNEHLESYQFPLLSFGPNVDAQSAASAVNCVHHLLLQRQKDIAYREESNDILRRSRSENESLQRKFKRMDEAHEKAQRENALLKLKQQSLEQDHRRQVSKLQSDLTELGKLNAQVQYKQTQLAHKMARKEKDCERLTEKVAKMMHDKEGKLGGGPKIVIINDGVPEPSRIPNLRKTPVDNFNTVISDAYEAKLEEHRTEITTLQRAMCVFNEEVVDMISHYSNGAVKAPQKGPEQFDVPFFLSREAIQDYFQSNIMMLDSALQATKGVQPQRCPGDLDLLHGDCMSDSPMVDKDREITIPPPLSPLGNATSNSFDDAMESDDGVICDRGLRH